MSDLIHGEPAKIAKFDGLAFSRIHLLKCVEASVEGHEVSASFLLKAHRLIQRHSETFPLAGLLTAGVVHQDLAHQPRSHSVEMRTILQARVGLIDESEVGLVDECRGLQSVALAFLPQIACGKLAEFAVHKGREVIQGILVASRPFGKQQRYFVGVRRSSDFRSTELER